MKSGFLKHHFTLLSLCGLLYLIKCNISDYTDDINSISFTSRVGTDEWDSGVSIVQTKDHSYYLLGNTTPYNNWYCWLAKLNKYGKKEWLKTVYSSTGSDMILENNTELITLFNNNNVIQFSKMNLTGDIYYTKIIRMFDFSARERGEIMKCMEDGFIISGSSDSLGGAQGPFNGFITRINSLGDILWMYSQHDAIFNSCVESNDDYYYSAGTYKTQSLNISNSLIVKIDSDGSLVWKRIFDSDLFGGITSIVRRSDNEFIVSGREDTYMLALINIDSTGNIIWETNYQGIYSQVLSNSLIIENSGVIAVLGTGYRDGQPFTILLKFNNNGNILSEEEFEGEYSNSLKTTCDHGLIFCTQSTSDSSFHARDVLVYKLGP